MKTLVFIYNAKSGKINATVDFLHKTLSPGTYSCNLCALTYGMFSERETWRNYRRQKDINMEFWYKDEFERTFHYKPEYPAVIETPEMNVLLTKDEIDRLESVEQLIQALERKLGQQKQ